MTQWRPVRKERVRTRASAAEDCSKRAIAVRWEIGNRVPATAALREIAHSLEPTTAARGAGTLATEVGTAEGATRMRIVEVETA